MSGIRRATFVLSLSCLAFAATADDRTRIVNEGGIRDQWTLADGVTLAVPGYPAEFEERGDNVCMAIGYAIDPKTGDTSEFTVLKQWSSGGKDPAEGYWAAYAQAGAGALAQWKFKPLPEVASPKRTVTVATMTFNGKKQMDPVALRAKCAISDLAATLQKANNDNLKDRNRIRRDLEQSLRNQNATKAMNQNPGLSSGK